MRPAEDDLPPAPQVLALKLTRRPVALASTLAAPGDQPLRADGRADCPRAPEISPMDAECFRIEVTSLLAISGNGALLILQQLPAIAQFSPKLGALVVIIDG